MMITIVDLHSIVVMDPVKVGMLVLLMMMMITILDLHSTDLHRILWVYCPGHAGVKGNNRADRLADKATITGGLRLGRSEVLRSLRHYLRCGHKAKDITPSIARRREA